MGLFEVQAEEKMKLKEKEKIKEKKEVGREEMENEKMEHNIHIEPITGQFRYNSNIFIKCRTSTTCRTAFMSLQRGRQLLR